MKIPKVGEIVYAAQDKQDRIGETMFLCSTQENCGKNLKKVKKEAIERLTEPEEEDFDEKTQTWLPVIEPENEKNLILWEMKRIL